LKIFLKKNHFRLYLYKAMSKGIVYIILILFLCSNRGFSQKEFVNWYFGDRAGLNFNMESANYTLDGQSSNANNPATISDSAGNLLFYYSNNTIYDRSHNIMQNGDDLEAQFSYNGNIIIPKPNTPNHYYLITSKWGIDNEESSKMYYSEIDMTLNGGLGGVTNLKNIVFADNILSNKITAVQHANDIDFWLMSHGLNNSDYYAYQITENGFTEAPVISSIGSIHPFNDFDFGGQIGGIRISHDAKRLASIYHAYPTNALSDSQSYLEIMDFNDQTGIVSGNVLSIGENTFNNVPSEFTGSGAAYLLEFSPNNQFLYVTCSNAYATQNGVMYPSALFQFDTSVDTNEELEFSASRLYNGNDRLSGIQWAFNNKLYLVSTNNNAITDQNNTLMSMGVINTPNLAGSFSDYQHLSIALSDERIDERKGTLGLPQDIRQFFFLKLFTEDLCGGQTINFAFETSNEVLAVEWNFNDGSTSNALSPTHSFLPGTYFVELTATYEDSVIRRLVLVEIPEVGDYNNEIILCDDASNDGVAVLTLEDLNNSVFGQDQCGLSTFHLTAADAEANLNPLDDNFTATNNLRILYLRLVQEFNNNNVIIIPITIGVSDFPTLLAQSYEICNANEQESITISTIEFDNLFNGNINCVNITYHLTSAHAESASNPITESFDMQGESQMIFVRIERLIDSSYTVQSFTVEIIPKPVINLEDTYYLCDNESLDIELDVGYDSYLWSTGAETSTVNIDASGTYSVTVSNETSAGECSETKIFNVVVSNIPTAVTLEINDLSSNNTIEIIAEGIGRYDYSLNDMDYQSSPIFENLRESEYTVYIRDANGCGTITEDAFLLVYPKFFTPNNDGENDYWQVKSAFTEPDLSVEIYDRYGKIYYTFKGSSLGWDGTLNGKELPTNDYWFKIRRPSKNKVYVGHFTLKR
jgi:gliding motility-associated-like protein